jgi:hypothetical protein
VEPPPVRTDQGQHERKEAEEVDHTADLKHGISGRAHVILGIERQHHKLRDDHQHAGRDGHRPSESRKR